MTAVDENPGATRLPDATATELFIGGQWRPASDGGTFTDLNPATGKPLVDVSAGTGQDIDDAVRAARTQLNGEWGSLPGAARGRILNKVADLIERDAEILARLEALDV
ncbi:aldehyde dehydrogenase family protein, partial [Rhodococcus wratislaviensis]|uniref:aldehyde dehydrogenase family protein n=1 Tax=Rhodococcus wratislaviensis TaxID=44752 RepID=UPI000F57D67F